MVRNVGRSGEFTPRTRRDAVGDDTTRDDGSIQQRCHIGARARPGVQSGQRVAESRDRHMDRPGVSDCSAFAVL